MVSELDMMIQQLIGKNYGGLSSIEANIEPIEICKLFGVPAANRPG